MGRRAVVLVIALLLAAAAAFSVFQFLNNIQGQYQDEQVLVEV